MKCCFFHFVFYCENMPFWILWCMTSNIVSRITSIENILGNFQKCTTLPKTNMAPSQKELVFIIFQASIFRCDDVSFRSSGKLTWPLKIIGWKTGFLLRRPIFGGELLVSGRVLHFLTNHGVQNINQTSISFLLPSQQKQQTCVLYF